MGTSPEKCTWHILWVSGTAMEELATFWQLFPRAFQDVLAKLLWNGICSFPYGCSCCWECSGSCGTEAAQRGEQREWNCFCKRIWELEELKGKGQGLFISTKFRVNIIHRWALYVWPSSENTHSCCCLDDITWEALRNIDSFFHGFFLSISMMQIVITG